MEQTKVTVFKFYCIHTDHKTMCDVSALQNISNMSVLREEIKER